MNIDEMLDRAREQLNRVDAQQAAEAVANGAVIVDIRIEAQQRETGMLPGAIAVNRNELEWLADPNVAGLDNTCLTSLTTCNPSNDTFGQILNTRAPREIQLGFKFYW